MLEEEAHPGQDRDSPIGENREGAAGVLPLGWFYSCVGPAWESGKGRNSGYALGLWALSRGTSLRECAWLGTQGSVYYVKVPSYRQSPPFPSLSLVPLSTLPMMPIDSSQ